MGLWIKRKKEEKDKSILDRLWRHLYFGSVILFWSNENQR